MARRLSQRGLDLRTDPDPNVRLCWIDAIAAGAGGSAAAELGKCLRDPDLRLRLATVRALGSVHGDQSQALLRTQLKDPGELIRSAAVTSLARLNDERAVLGAADDPSWRVRKAVAESLATFPTRQASVVAERLLVDQSPDVEVAVVDAVGAWPLERAGNLLLMACSQTALATRERAADHLSKQWPPAGDFSPTAPPERRAEVLDELRAAWAAEFGEIDRSLLAQTTPQRVPAVAPMPHLDEIRVLVTELATQRSTEVQRRQLARLRGYDRELIPALEYLATVERLHLIDAIYHDALPQIDPAFRLLMSMESADLQTRREASGRLATLAADTSLRPLVLLRLSQRVPHEADGVVWINVWRMIEHDAREPSLRIAYAALGHSEVEVRLKACEYLAAHPAREHAPFLTATLADKSPNVARAAAAALGRCGPLEDLSGLTSALAARDPGLRLAAAVSLAQLGSEEGRVALERFTYEGDSDLRRSSAVAIGTLGDREFIPALIRLLDDRDNVRRAALEALVQITGGDVAERPGEPPASLPERAQRWKQWWAAQNQDSVPQP
jgi:HEAT repeat protein